MKKVILSLVFVLATGTSFINASSSNVEYIDSKSETKEILEEFGCARDCVDAAMEKVFLEATADLQEPTISDYLEEYEFCYITNC